jgi:hypothetical protein
MQPMLGVTIRHPGIAVQWHTPFSLGNCRFFSRQRLDSRNFSANLSPEEALVKVNWTSTTVPLWEKDCIEFWRARSPFELRDVTSEEHERFAVQFAAEHGLDLVREGTTFRFTRKEE